MVSRAKVCAAGHPLGCSRLLEQPNLPVSLRLRVCSILETSETEQGRDQGEVVDGFGTGGDDCVASDRGGVAEDAHASG